MSKPAPFTHSFTASPHETVKRLNYRWRNDRRGDQPQVILQRTFSGIGCFRIGRRRHLVPPGHLFIALVPENAEYWFDPALAPHWRFHWLNLAGGFAHNIWRQLRERFGAVVPVPEDSAAANAMTRLIADIEAGHLGATQPAAEATYRFFVTLWTQLEGGERGTTPPVARLRELIRGRFREPVNLKELSAEVGLSREHLSREFHRVYGMEPGNYLRRLRLEAAEIFLQQTLLGLDEIAARTGFSSSRQLTRFFRQRTGLTPVAFRNRARAGKP